MASLSSAANFERIKLIMRKIKKLSSSSLVYETVAPKKSAQLYEDCIKSIELEFGKCSQKLSLFTKLIQECKEQRITVREVESRTDRMFKDHPKLHTNFRNAVLPCLYPVSTRDEVDRANQFIYSVESAFPNNPTRCELAENLIAKFQDGRLSLKYMTVEMLKLMENRDDLIEAYIKFVPQAEHVTASIVSISRFISYLAVVIAIIVTFGTGFYTMKN